MTSAHAAVHGSLRVALAGGMPKRLGGGGLEEAMARTAKALTNYGITASDVSAGNEPFDVLHCFGTEPIVWHLLRNWTHNRCPLVVTPTVVLGRATAAATVALARVRPGLSTTASMRRDVLRQAQAILCLTEWERSFCQRLGCPSNRLFVVSNGSDAPRRPPQPLDADSPVLMVGAVCERKRQVEVLEALGVEFPVVIAGSFAGGSAYRRRFDQALRRTGAVWLGHVDSRETLLDLQRRSRAQLLVSDAEGQSLAVLDALAVGTHVVLSDIPVHRELHATYPDHSSLVASPQAALAAVRAVRLVGRTLPSVPTWDEVGRSVADVYRSLT